MDVLKAVTASEGFRSYCDHNMSMGELGWMRSSMLSSRRSVSRPMGRTGEVAHAIAFMVSGSVTFITEVNLPVDRGRYAMCPI